MSFIAFIKALPEIMAAFKKAMEMWKQMQDNAFYRDSQKAFAQLESAKDEEEIKKAVVALRDVYKRV